MVNRSEAVIAVRVRTGSSRTRVGGRYDGAFGPALVVAVAQPAVDGRATEAVLRAVAEALGLRRSAVSLRSGQSSRDKLITIAAAAGDRVRELRDGQ